MPAEFDRAYDRYISKVAAAMLVPEGPPVVAVSRAAFFAELAAAERAARESAAKLADPFTRMEWYFRVELPAAYHKDEQPLNDHDPFSATLGDVRALMREYDIAPYNPPPNPDEEAINTAITAEVAAKLAASPAARTGGT